MKKMMSILLVFLMLTALGCAAYADTGIGVEPGQVMPDFTVPLTDGTTATLSELLKEKELVVLNVFASWCGPCEREFPEMESVYQEQSDRMEILSVSGYFDDTMEIISDYKASHGLTFPMGLAGDGLDFLRVSAYPTTIFVDRDGKVGFVKIGAFASREDFEEKVNTFLSPDYNGEPLSSEKATDFSLYIYGWVLLGALLLMIGRWGILRKAGKKGWHSLIPFLNVYKEYSICWNGWFGVLADLCPILAFAATMAGLPIAVDRVLTLLGFLIGVPESLRLAKVFGKSTFFGVLMALPVLRQILRLVLGVSKAKYRQPGSETAAA